MNVSSIEISYTMVLTILSKLALKRGEKGKKSHVFLGKCVLSAP